MRVNRAIDDRPGIQQEAICYQWFKQRLILSVSKPSISQRSQITEDTVEPSVPAREFNSIRRYNLTMIWPAWASKSPIIVASQRVRQRYQQRHRGRQLAKSMTWKVKERQGIADVMEKPVILLVVG